MGGVGGGCPVWWVGVWAQVSEPYKSMPSWPEDEAALNTVTAAVHRARDDVRARGVVVTVPPGGGGDRWTLPNLGLSCGAVLS